MKKSKVLMLSVLTTFVMALSADASLEITVDGQSFDVSLSPAVSWPGAASIVESTPWWGNSALAYDVAGAVGLSLGTPNQAAGIYPDGPIVAVGGGSGGYNGELYGWSVVEPTAPNVTSTIVYGGLQAIFLEGEVAPVPEPSTLLAGILVLAVLGFGVARRNVSVAS